MRGATHYRKMMINCMLGFALVCALVIFMTSCSAVEEFESGGSGKLEVTDYGYCAETDSVYAAVVNQTDRTAVYIPVDLYLLDADGNPVQMDGQDFYITDFLYYLKPGDQGTVTQYVGVYDGVADMKASIVKEQFISSSSEDPSDDGITVSNVSLDGTELRYTITNDSDKDYEYYQANIIYYDKDGKCCGGEEAIQKGIPAHSDVEKSWVINDIGDTSQYDVEVQVKICSEADNKWYKDNNF